VPFKKLNDKELIMTTLNKKVSEVLAVLDNAKIEQLHNAGLTIWNGVNSVDLAHGEILNVLLENADSLGHFNAVQHHTIQGMMSGKGFSQGYANTLWGDFMKFARDEGYKKPQTQKAQALAEKREFEKKSLDKKHGHKTLEQLKSELVQADNKELEELTKVIKMKNSERKAEEKENNSEFLKEVKVKINELLKVKNENAIENATKILAFIKKENLK